MLSSFREKEVVSRRDGSVLAGGTILKYDIWAPGKDRFPPSLPDFPAVTGTSALRRIPSMPLWLSAQPTLGGITGAARAVRLREGQDVSTIRWLLLREEPLVYLHGRPHVLRDSDDPFRDINDTQGITAQRIHNIEARLKAEILAEASTYGGMVLIHREAPGGKLEHLWEAADEDSVMTPAEVFERSSGRLPPAIVHLRAPLTPESVPSVAWFDSVMAETALWRPLPSDGEAGGKGGCAFEPLVVNCARGRKRSTFTATVILMIRRWARGSAGAGGDGADGTGGRWGAQVTRQDIDDMDPLRRGEYRHVLSMTRMLEGGKEAKAEADACIDEASFMDAAAVAGGRDKDGATQTPTSASFVNLRGVVLDELSRAKRSRDEKEMAARLERASVSLRVYILLVAFAAYLGEEKSGGSGSEKQPPKRTFAEFLDAHSEIHTMLEECRSDPLGSLVSRIARKPAGMVSPEGKKKGKKRTALEGEIPPHRMGTILSPEFILKADPPPHGVLTISHGAAADTGTCRGFHSVWGIGSGGSPVLGEVLSRVTATGCKAVRVMSLRDEPLVFVRGMPYAARPARVPLLNSVSYRGISRETVESMEDRLRQEVIDELEACPGTIWAHAEDAVRTVRPFTLRCVKAEEIQTPRQFYASVASRLGIDIRYTRVPTSPRTAPSAAGLDAMTADLVQDAKDGASVVFTCEKGRGRSSVAMVVALLVEGALHKKGACVSDIAGTKGDLASVPLLPPMGFTAELELLRVLPDGNGTRALTDALIQRCAEAEYIPMSGSTKTDLPGTPGGGGGAQGKRKSKKSGARDAGGDDDTGASAGYDDNGGGFGDGDLDHAAPRSGSSGIRGSIVAALRRSNAARGLEAAALRDKCKGYLERYLALVAFAAHVRAAGHSLAAAATFASFIEMHPEIAKPLGELAAQPASSLVIVGSRDADAPATSGGIVASRRGAVLSINHVLKVDHFPGVHRTHLPVALPGAPNFRKVHPALPVYGCAIPTSVGVRSILDHVIAEPLGPAASGCVGVTVEDGVSRVVWVNLREEPITYVNTTPYVLRNADVPYGNIEHTGISSAGVSAMEDRLRADILEEAATLTPGQVLVHDEDSAGNLVGHLEEASAATVLTTAMVYEETIAAGGYVSAADDAAPSSGAAPRAVVAYHRLPVTDEHAPLLDDFDDMVKLFGLPIGPNKGNNNNTAEPPAPPPALILNCQAGRGRTTTAMVIACLVHLESGSPAVSAFAADVRQAEAQTESESDLSSSSGGGDGGGDDAPEGADPMQRYVRGEYKVVVGLLRAIDGAARAKRTLDAVLDIADHMQNLRTAIATYYEAVLADDGNKGARHRGHLYLTRYFFLIAFNTWLQAGAKGSFKEWYLARPELDSLLKQCDM